MFCTFWVRNVLRATAACSFSFLIWPGKKTDPQIIGKTQCFATFLTFSAPVSSFFWLFSLSLFYSSLLVYILLDVFLIMTEPWLAANATIHLPEAYPYNHCNECWNNWETNQQSRVCGYTDRALLDRIGLWSGFSADTMNERIHHRPTRDKVIETIRRTDLSANGSSTKWKHYLKLVLFKEGHTDVTYCIYKCTYSFFTSLIFNMTAPKRNCHIDTLYALVK